MANPTRSSVLFIKQETTEGTLVNPAGGSEATVLREGFTFESGTDVLTSDELVNDIGASKSVIAKETPSASVPKYFKHSGVEGQEPDWGMFLYSAMGTKEVNATEYDLVGGSTAGTTAARAVLNVDTGEGATFSKGEAVLIKDGTNGYSVRNVRSISSDALTINYNLPGAPALGVNLGKAIHYSPAATGHPTFSAHLYQASSGSALHQAMAGCRTTSLGIEFPANDFASITVDFEGIEFFWNPITIDASNFSIDFDDGGGEENASLTQKTYKSPIEFAAEVESKMDALTADTITVSYSNTTGKFTIATDGGTLSLLWNTGTNTATTAGAELGFATAADDTGATSYVSDNAQDLDPAFTPTYDSQDPIVVRQAELLLGDFFRTDCIQANSVSFTIDTPKTDVEDFCAVSGVSESIVLSREATFSATILLNAYEAEYFDKFINNTTTELMMNAGEKVAGNWVAGTVVNIYMANASITGHTVTDQDGLLVIELTGTGFVDTDQKDVHINLL